MATASEYSNWSHIDLERAIEAAGVALWSWNGDTDDLVMDGQGYALWNIDQRESLTFERLSRNIHPADKDRVRAAFTATRALVGRYEIDFRIIVGGDVRWISARGQGDDAGIHNVRSWVSSSMSPDENRPRRAMSFSQAK